MDYLKIIDFFYQKEPELKEKLLSHSRDVCRKALDIAADSDVKVDRDTVIAGAMLHDIGILRCHAPSIGCFGNEHYIRHGIIGGNLLKQYGSDNGIDLSTYSRICERHTGSGMTCAEIIRQKLPLSAVDMLPETPEEKLICLADKFFSKSGDGKEKSIPAIEKGMAKFGPDSLKRFHDLLEFFNVPDLH